MSKIDIEPKGRFATALKMAIEENGMTLTQVAQETDYTYEHMRKLVAGVTNPPPLLVKALARLLKADASEWSELAEADKLFKKYKHLPKFLGISKELEPFEAIIPKLSPDARETLLAMAKTLARQEGQRK
jgi:hypothetical protein